MLQRIIWWSKYVVKKWKILKKCADMVLTVCFPSQRELRMIFSFLY